VRSRAAVCVGCSGDMLLPTHVHAMLGLLALCIVFVCSVQWTLSEDLALAAVLRRGAVRWSNRSSSAARSVIVPTTDALDPWDALWDALIA
jgi:hypothetical protein